MNILVQPLVTNMFVAALAPQGDFRKNYYKHKGLKILILERVYVMTKILYPKCCFCFILFL
jgi:hypothetical protein